MRYMYTLAFESSRDGA